jgi:hypothetical protein
MFTSQAQDRNHQDSGRHDHQRRRGSGRARVKDVQQGQGSRPDGKGHPMGRSQLPNEMPELVKDIAVASGQTEQLGDLAHGNVDR